MDAKMPFNLSFYTGFEHLQHHLARQSFPIQIQLWGIFLVAGCSQQASGCKQAEKQAPKTTERSSDVQLIRG